MLIPRARRGFTLLVLGFWKKRYAKLDRRRYKHTRESRGDECSELAQWYQYHVMSLKMGPKCMQCRPSFAPLDHNPPPRPPFGGMFGVVQWFTIPLLVHPYLNRLKLATEQTRHVLCTPHSKKQQCSLNALCMRGASAQRVGQRSKFIKH